MFRLCLYCNSLPFGKPCLIKLLTITLGLLVGCGLARLLIDPKRLCADSPNTEFKEVPQDNNVTQHDTNTMVADHMRQEIRILCWIMTGPKNHMKKCQHIRHTWGRHCNVLIFMTTEEDSELEGTIPLPVNEGRDSLWPKTREAFKYIYDNHRNDADWFLKADDDSYVVMENLRSMLHPYSPESPIYFGRKFFHPPPNQGYMSGGAGYVLSVEAMLRFVEKAMTNTSICLAEKGPPEDLELGNCLEKVGVLAGDSRDMHGYDRFFPFQIWFHLFPKYNPEWYYRYSFYPALDGRNGIPPNTVSFHYVDPKYLYLFDYAIYHIRTYGRGQLSRTLDETKFTMEEVIADLAASRPKNRTINAFTG